MPINKLKTLFVALLLLVFISVAPEAIKAAKTVDIPAVVITAEEEEELDPLESVNRGIYRFNDTIDGLFLEPIAKGYRALVPEWGRERVGNAISNLTSPVSFMNSLLQQFSGMLMKNTML